MHLGKFFHGQHSSHVNVWLFPKHRRYKIWHSPRWDEDVKVLELESKNQRILSQERDNGDL